MSGQASRQNGKKGGRRKGSKNQTTLDKEASRELVRQIVTAHLEPMTLAQVANAKGIQHFVLRDKAGKFEKVTSEEAAIAAMNDPEAVYDFWTKDPSIAAYADLVNRANDKPKEQVMDVKVTGEIDLVARLVAGRKRLSSGS